MFILHEIELFAHPILGTCKVDFDAIGGKSAMDKIMTTVIIGPNGVGKSYMMRAIIEIFRYIEYAYALTKTPSLKYRFTIAYSINGVQYRVSNHALLVNTSKLKCWVNGTEIHIMDKQHLEEMIKLPSCIIASAMTIVDRFLTPSSGRYFYKGNRNEQTPSTSGTRTIIRKTVDNLIECVKTKSSWREELLGLLQVLELQPILEIRYKIYYENVFLNGNMYPEKLREIFSNQREYFPRRSGDVWGTDKFKRIRNNYALLENVCNYLNKLYNNPCPLKNYVVNYNLFSQRVELCEDREAIKLLSELGILQYPEVVIYKNETSGYEFSESSSGEMQLFCQMVGIMSSIKENSLVLIDEPENSMHPNWQIRYIDYLQKIFHAYTDAHFILSTHSHFTLTDLAPEWSRIVCLNRKDGHVIDVAEGVDTYCWSVDEILYKVFEMRNTRNRIFENKLYQLYDYIANDDMALPEAQKLLAELKRYQLSEDDPLKEIIKMAE